jgi:subtilase family serine protease
LQKAASRPLILHALLGAFVIALLGESTFAFGQSQAPDRITQDAVPGVTTALPGSVSPLAQPAFDIGRADPSTRLTGMTIYFRLSAAQQAALNQLLAQQQTPGSPFYHKWITPTQYASQFGLSANDLAKVQTWLEQQGFSIDGVSNSHNAISFSGTVAQVEAAFQTQIHHYNINGVTHTANSTPLSVPSAFAGVVLSVRNISDFRPHPLHRLRRPAVSPQYTFTSGGVQYHFLAPGDFATIYDLNSLYSAGYTGSGETIVLVGQSAIETSDITNFQKAAGLTQKAPTITLVPGTGTSELEDSDGDEDESDLDLEWSGAVATGATLNFVYVGNNLNYSVFDSIQYAIDNDLGSIISTSYGACEADFSSTDISTIQGWFEQASSQGQTVVAAAGDNGATDCEIDSGKGATVVDGDEATLGLAVDYPGSSPYVTSIGGTEFLADVSSPGTYWNSSNSTAGNSAIQYIPEEVWNDTSPSLGLEAGGGGKSILFGKPSWQTGNGVPNDGARDVPDISLNASPNHDGYLFCATGSDTNDPSACSNGFLNSSGDPEVAGGTSFGAPTFSGILAILSQKLGTAELGNVNPQIYSLAGSDYSSAFHDTTVGNNEIPCEIGSVDCKTSPIGYSATTGYDLASGWGSIDGANFVNGLSPTSSLATTTTLTASSTTPVVNTAITLTATVTSDSGSTTPAGTVQFVIDGTNAGSPVTLSNTGVATYSYTPTTAGSHTIVANYTPSNTAVSSASSDTLTIVVSTTTSSQSFTLSATNVTVAQGGSVSSAVTLTPSGGFTGTVSLTVSAPSTLTNACFTYVNPSVSSSGAVTNGSVTVNTSESACTSTGNKRIATIAGGSGKAPGRGNTYLRAGSGIALASLMFLGLPGLRRRRWSALCVIAFLAAFTFAVSGCGSSGSSSSSSSGSGTAPTGSYTLTLIGTNTTLNFSTSTTFTLTVN